MRITDISGNIITVTDIDKAIDQCRNLSESPYKMQCGKTVGENHRHMLDQLLKLKNTNNDTATIL